MIDLRARELDELGTRKPEGMPTDQQLRIYGGGALIFDEYCRLKYHVRNKIANPERQTQRLKYLWSYGYFNNESAMPKNFAAMHRLRFA
jgi:hypothetical protein